MMKAAATVFAVLFVPLASALAIVDQDNDTLSDIWEVQHNFSLQDNGTLYPDQSPSADPDSDGLTNWQEAVAGTDPWDSSSRLLLTLVRDEVASELRIQFSTVITKRYQVETRTNLMTGSWSSLGPVITGDGAEAVVVTTLPQQAGTPVFFRLQNLEEMDDDDDGLTAWEEYQLGTNPNNPDSDDDGISDYDEFIAGTDPNDPAPTITLLEPLGAVPLD